jgi:hypothetical protein
MKATIKAKSIMKTFVGWLLLFAGLLIIGWGLFSSYKIFTAKELAPEIFKTKISEETNQPLPKKKGDIPEKQMQALFQEQLQQQLREVLPADFLPTLFNLISWSIFVGLLIFGGYRISLLGIRLIR